MTVAEVAEDPLAHADLSRVGAAQAAEIEDRVATEEEYTAAFERYRSCLQEAGHLLGSVQRYDLVWNFALPDAAVQDGSDDACYAAEYGQVDMLWQSREEVQAESGIVEWSQECLRQHGIEPAATSEAMGQQLREVGMDYGDCL